MPTDTDANSFVSSSVGEHGEEATGNSEKDMNEESRIVVADDSGGDGVIRAACARVTGAVITGKSRDNLIAKLPLTLVSLENKVNAGR